MAHTQYPRNRLGTCELLLIALFPATHLTSTRGWNLNFYVVTVRHSIVLPPPLRAGIVHSPMSYILLIIIIGGILLVLLYTHI